MKTVRMGACMASALLTLVPAVGTAQGVGPATEDQRSHAEISEFTEYTPYDSMMVYLGRVQASSTEMRLGVYGESHEGRALPYAIFARPSITQPWEAWSLGKPILVLAANVHGGERTLRESALVLIRELATSGSEMNGALDDLTILVVPQINPDGFSAEPRATRGNLWGLDLNRDYMKLEQPEIQAYTQNILHAWAPHLTVDGHNGGSAPYNINYQCPSHSAPDPRLTALCDDLLFPAIDGSFEEAGYRAWYYTGGNETRWNVGGSDPRIGRNYGGFANMVGILFESPGGQEMRDGVNSGRIAYETVVRWSSENAELLLETVRTARLETVLMGEGPSGEVPIEVEYAPENRTVDYLIVSGSGGETGIVEIQSDSLMKRPVTTLSRPRPWAYTVPRDALGAVELLRRHNIQVETLREPVAVTVDAYTIGSVSTERAYNHAAATKIEVHETLTREVTLPEGTYIVRTGQMQGRIAAHLLEAETRDGVVFWNRMDPWIPEDEVARFVEGEGEAPTFPIFKLMAPTALPTDLLASGSR